MKCTSPPRQGPKLPSPAVGTRAKHFPHGLLHTGGRGAYCEIHTAGLLLSRGGSGAGRQKRLQVAYDAPRSVAPSLGTLCSGPAVWSGQVGLRVSGCTSGQVRCRGRRGGRHVRCVRRAAEPARSDAEAGQRVLVAQRGQRVGQRQRRRERGQATCVAALRANGRCRRGGRRSALLRLVCVLGMRGGPAAARAGR